MALSRRSLLAAMPAAALAVPTALAGDANANLTDASSPLVELGRRFDAALAAWEAQFPAYLASDARFTARLKTLRQTDEQLDIFNPPDNWMELYDQAWRESGHEPFAAANEEALDVLAEVCDAIDAAPAVSAVDFAVKARRLWWSCHSASDDVREDLCGFMAEVERAGGLTSLWAERVHRKALWERAPNGSDEAT